jgi:uncharacterized membrane protein SpoIIM required for sporulation
MRETDFINDHSPKWQDIEDALKTPPIEPDTLKDMFVQVTDDLSYARTFYPNRSVRVYLNDLAKRLFFYVYAYNIAKSKRTRSFWGEELPLLMYGARRDMLIAFLVFWVAFIAGALSCAMDPDFPKLILGETYVKMTEANIAAGDPMAVYKSRGQFDMALGITANNLYVAFLSFISGIFFAIGALMIMISNGIMVGAFQYFFAQQGLFQESFLTIWVHGTLEISAIIIAGGAGITMGRGLAFPGTYSRLQAFRQSARRGLKIFFGIVPVIILAALSESFLTRYTDTPDEVRGAFIFACLTFILVYFWWFPRHVASRVSPDQNRDADLLAEIPQVLELENIRSGDEIFRDVFSIMRHKISQVCTFAGFATAIFCFPVFLFSGLPPQELFSMESGFLASLQALGQFYVQDKAPWVPWLNVPVMAWVSANLLPRLMGSPRQAFLPGMAPVLKMLLPAGFFILLLQSKIEYAGLVMLFCFPWLLCWASVIALEKDQKNLGTQRTFSLLRTNTVRVLHVFLLLVLSAGLFFSLLDTALIWGFLNLTAWVVRLDPQAMEAFSAVLFAALTYFFHYLAFGFILAGFGLLHFTLREISSADGLRKKIENIGQKRLLRGLEQELPR